MAACFSSLRERGRAVGAGVAAVEKPLRTDAVLHQSYDALASSR
jgi:hypothetical protein